MRRSLAALPRRLLDLALPPRCGRCEALVNDPGSLCAECWAEMAFIGAPLCDICGVPFELQIDDALCGDCLARRPTYGRARAAVVYDDASRSLILPFKHADRTDLAPLLARWLAQAGAALLAEADLLVPVPLHRRRLWRRRFNQAGLLARQLGGLADLPVDYDLLSRVRATRSQGGLSRQGRFRNLRGAFAVAAAGRARLGGRRLVLVDDVMTTGATAEACARVLCDHGAAQVDVIALARVVR